MKMEIESKDIDAVKETLSGCYQINLTDLQARELIEGDDHIAAYLYMDRSILGQLGRETLLNGLIYWLMDEKITIDMNEARYYMDYWSWPDLDATILYRKEFEKAFVNAAKKAGIELGPLWNE